MRLLELQTNGSFHLTSNLLEDDLPPYAILSHTWGDDNQEVSYEDLVEGSGGNKAGYVKIQFCADQAARDNLRYFWVDSCCIKKSSDAELSEAINSMFRWYRGAVKCYVYLSDVSTRHKDEINQSSQVAWESSFRESKWFTRGWTLQELLAPASVEFFSENGKRLGDKKSLKEQIHGITGIAVQALQGQPMSDFSVKERFSWTANRKTKRKEDQAYSLLGIFDVFMPACYGEGGENASRRLHDAISGASNREHTEPAFKRRKVESPIPDVDHSLPPPANTNLLDSLRFDQIDDRFVNIKPGHTKTCRWLLESTEYLDWLSAVKLPKHHGFFWIKGKPGCGKSTLTKFAFMDLRKSSRNTILLSFFFNARGSHLEKSTIGLYRSLLVQLLEKCPGDQRVWNITNLTYRASDDQLKTNREMLKHHLAQAVQMLDQYEVTVIVDALDECDEDEVRDMIAFFEKLGEDAVSDGRTFHVLFSSRHYPHITIRRSVELILEDQPGHSQDIDKYLSSELKAGRGKKAENIRQEVRDRASGIFMWIVLVVQILNKAFDHGQVHALQKKLREIPNDLNELFRRILTRDDQNLREMKLCLQWILYANRPLKPEELYFAILSGTEPEESFQWDMDAVSTETMELFILSSSKGLAEITKSKYHTVQFIHESVRDFLLKENGLGRVWVDLKSDAIGLSHNSLRECCCNYMSSNITDRLGVNGLLPSASSPEAAELRKNASLRFPFLEYAVCNTFAHADVAHVEGVSQECFVKQFELSNWIQLNNIVEKYQVRRLPPNIDLLYILAERNCYNLINTLMRNGPPTRSQNGRYGNPIFAAIANNNHQAFEALVRGDSQTHPRGSEFPYPCDKITTFLVKHGKPALIHRFISVYNIDVTSTLKGGGTILSWAAENGHEKVAEVLISRGVDIDVQGGEYGNALQAASFKGHEKVVQLFLDKNVGVNAQGGRYGYALQAASVRGHEKVVQTLLDGGAEINAQGEYYGSALQAASVRGHEKVVEILLNGGAEVNAQGGHHGNALQAASAYNREKVVKILLDGEAEVNAQGGYYGNALQAASVCGYEKVVEILLNSGAEVNTQGGYHGNVLQAASVYGHERVVEILLDGGAEVNTQGGHHGNALQAASAGGYEKVVQILLHGGAEVNAQGGHHGNALQAASAGGYEKVVQILLDGGAEINAQGGLYDNALQATSAGGYKKVVQILLDGGAEINAQGGLYDNALQAASAGGYEKVVQILLDGGAEINAQGGLYNNALRAISAGDYKKVVQTLLDGGAEINAQGEYYGNALQAASVRGHEKVVEILLNGGAEVNAQGGLYGNALQAASAGGYKKVVQQLLDKNADVN